VDAQQPQRAAALIHHRTLSAALTPDGRLYDERLGYGEDLDLMMRLLRATPDDGLGFVDLPVYVKHIGPGTISHDVASLRILGDHVRLAARYPRALSLHLARYAFLVLAQGIELQAGAVARRLGRPQGRLAEQMPHEAPDVQARLRALAEAGGVRCG